MNETIHLNRDHLYDIGGKVLSLDEIQQAVIDASLYQEQVRIARGDCE